MHTRDMTHTAHAPVSHLNPSTEVGIKTIVGCSCGWMPKAASMTATGLTSAHRAHRRSLKLARADYAATTIGAGYRAAGMTHEQWRASGAVGDPYAIDA
jgi:hypothetical protein